jgi:hypothetical protein
MPKELRDTTDIATDPERLIVDPKSLYSALRMLGANRPCSKTGFGEPA